MFLQQVLIEPNRQCRRHATPRKTWKINVLLGRINKVETSLQRHAFVYERRV
jgi:hypothetical protein